LNGIERLAEDAINGHAAGLQSPNTGISIVWHHSQHVRMKAIALF
jgi:hypothetical protein